MCISSGRSARALSLIIILSTSTLCFLPQVQSNSCCNSEEKSETSEPGGVAPGDPDPGLSETGEPELVSEFIPTGFLLSLKTSTPSIKKSYAGIVLYFYIVVVKLNIYGAKKQLILAVFYQQNGREILQSSKLKFSDTLHILFLHVKENNQRNYFAKAKFFCLTRQKLMCAVPQPSQLSEK